MTRLRKANRNKKWQERHHAREIEGLNNVIRRYEVRAQEMNGMVLRERTRTEQRAQEMAGDLLKIRHLKEVLDRMSYEFAQADKRSVHEWMMKNRDLCLRYGLNSISDAARFIEHEGHQRRARVEGGRFNLTVDQERRMKRIRLSFPALTYEMMVEDSTIDA
jgi:hypothetical protein